jgi:hypothetical protein
VKIDLHCEICDAEVNDSGAHYVATRNDPHRDGCGSSRGYRRESVLVKA